MPPPVYVYYELSSFYQNDFRFRKSFSAAQLEGCSPSDPDCRPSALCAACYPRVTLNDSSPVLAPCGLLPWFLFSDCFDLPRGFDKRDVTWRNELRNFRTPNYPPESRWMLGVPELEGETTSPKFVVWARIATTGRVRKLYARSPDRLDAGTYEITARVDHERVPGNVTRTLVVTTNAKAGGRGILMIAANSVLAVLWAAAALATVIAMRCSLRQWE
jgi:hypothetical protein